jgi:hypothetical protein
MKKYFAGFFVLGFVVGFIVMGFLAMHASKVFLKTVRYGYLGQEEMLAIEARRKGDLATALLHYGNVVDLPNSPILQYMQTQPQWGFTFPLAALVIERMTSAPGVAEGEKKLEGMGRLQVAMVLEEMGRKEEAQDQYGKAAKVLNVSVERAIEISGTLRQNKDLTP